MGHFDWSFTKTFNIYNAPQIKVLPSIKKCESASLYPKYISNTSPNFWPKDMGQTIMLLGNIFVAHFWSHIGCMLPTSLIEFNFKIVNFVHKKNLAYVFIRM
jgi:hypothetical protein